LSFDSVFLYCPFETPAKWLKSDGVDDSHVSTRSRCRRQLVEIVVQKMIMTSKVGQDMSHELPSTLIRIKTTDE